MSSLASLSSCSGVKHVEFGDLGLKKIEPCGSNLKIRVKINILAFLLTLNVVTSA